MGPRAVPSAEARLLGGAALAVGVVVALPLLFLLAELLLGGESAAGAIAAALGSARTWVLLGRSLGIAAAVTALTLLVGVPLGVLLGKYAVPGRRWIFVLHAFPLFLPPFLLALGWFHLLGREGYVGGAMTARWLFSEAGVIVILALTFLPIVTGLVALALQGVDPSLEEAARTVAPPRRVVARILLPIAWPAAAVAALVVFALSLSELAVPMFLRVAVYPAAVFSRLGGIDYAPGEAFALALPLLAVALLLVWVEARLLGRRPLTVAGLRSGYGAPLPVRRPWLAAGVGWLVAAISVAPLVVLALRAAGGGYAAVPEWIGSSLYNSLLAAAITATLATALGVVVGRALARRRRGARFLDALLVLAFFTPAAALGAGLISVWNRPATQLVYTSVGILVVGFLARYAVLGTRIIALSIAQSPVELEEAAAAHGGGLLRRLRRIVVPLHARGVGAAWLLVLVFCLRDLETAVLCYPPGGEPLTVRIFTLEANGPPRLVAALATVHVAVTAALLVLGGKLLTRRRA